MEPRNLTFGQLLGRGSWPQSAKTTFKHLKTIGEDLGDSKYIFGIRKKSWSIWLKKVGQSWKNLRAFAKVGLH